MLNMVTSAESLRLLAERLATSVAAPVDDAPDGLWDQWIDAMELDSTIGGWITSALAGGPVDRSGLKAAQVRLVANPQWRVVIGDRYDLLIDCVIALGER